MRWKAVAAIGGLGSNTELTLCGGVGSLSVKVGVREVGIRPASDQTPIE